MEIRPIRNDEDHAWAVAEIERLWNADPGTADDDRLDVLATLVDAYETKRWPVEPLHPVDMIRHAMVDQGHSQKDLAELLGSRSRASEVLARKRPLTVSMIHLLHERWGLPAAALIRPYVAGERKTRIRAQP